jgi:hypothetical protein
MSESRRVWSGDLRSGESRSRGVCLVAARSGEVRFGTSRSRGASSDVDGSFGSALCVRVNLGRVGSVSFSQGMFSSGQVRSGTDCGFAFQPEVIVVKTTSFTPGSRLPDDQAEEVEAELDQIADQRGYLTPRMVVEAARPQTSRLHQYFEWDDQAAAEEYRLAQARHLVRSVTVRVVDRNNNERSLPKFHNVHVQRVDNPLLTERVYAPLSAVRRSEDLIAQVQRKVEEDLLSARRRWEAYRHITEFHQRFARIFTEVDALTGEQGRAAD